MSTISASTTSTTAYKVTADTTGTLVFQTGATPTTALTIGSDQSVTFAGAQTYTGGATFTSGITVQGITVGRGAGAEASNTAVGANALATNAGGYENVAIGTISMNANTSGTFNTAVGRASLYSNTTGSYNTANGNGALQTNTTASNNTAVGYQASYGNTTATATTAVGYQANYTGQTTGNGGSTVMGYQAAYSSQNLNDAFGYQALTATTTGTSNVGVGFQALKANTTADGNTAMGYQAGYTNITGTYNTYVGWHAGYVATGSGNSYLGTTAGYAMTSGSKNTIVGAYGGNQGGLDIRTASNYIVLSDGDGNPRGIFDNSGNLLVGQTGAGYSNTNSFCVGPSVSGGGTGTFNHASGTLSGTSYVIFAYNAGAIGSVGQSGTTAVAYNTTSDYRLKENVQPLSGALAKVAALKPCTYTWKSAPDEIGEGFIAHELAEICPQAVTGAKDAVDEEGNPVYQGIDTSFLVATLTAAIQELKAELDTAKAQIAALQGAA